MTQDETWLVVGIAVLWFLSQRENTTVIPPDEPLKIPIPDWLQGET